MLSVTEAPPGGLLPTEDAPVDAAVPAADAPRPSVPPTADGRPLSAASSDSAAGAGAAWTPPSWQEIVEQHSQRVYRLAFRLTGNKHDAEDLTQEVFVRVFRSLDSYTPGTFEGWLHRITTNLFLDQMRRKQRIRFDAFAEDADDRLPGDAPTPHEAFAANNLDLDVRAALDSLQPDFRAAVVLGDIEGLSYEEISEVLGVKLGTVRSRIHRGRAALREVLAHRAPTRPGLARPAGWDESGVDAAGFEAADGGEQ
ncbi:MAG: RNA polymerase sigma factor SigE [Actinomycetes bacterium]